MIEDKDIYKEFCTIVEERLLDDVCSVYKMDWYEFIDRVRSGWNPEIGSNGCTHTAINEYTLNCYREAYKKKEKL